MMKAGSVNCFCVVVSSLVMAGTWTNEYSDPYSCYGDVCNFDTSAQFCDIVYRYCRWCDEIKGDCFTRHQPFNCTEYCYELRYEKEVEQLRVAGCLVPPPPEHGRFEGANTHVSINAMLEVTCEEGYELRNKDPFVCDNFSMWIGSQPKCEGSTNNTQTVAICLGVFFAMSFVLNLALLTTKYWSRVLCNRNEKISEQEENKPLVNSNTNDKQPNGIVHNEDERTVDPKTPSEDQRRIDLNEPSVSDRQAPAPTTDTHNDTNKSTNGMNEQTESGAPEADRHHKDNVSNNTQPKQYLEHIADDAEHGTKGAPSNVKGINKAPAEGANKRIAKGNPLPDDGTAGANTRQRNRGGRGDALAGIQTCRPSVGSGQQYTALPKDNHGTQIFANNVNIIHPHAEIPKSPNRQPQEPKSPPPVYDKQPIKATSDEVEKDKQPIKATSDEVEKEKLTSRTVIVRQPTEDDGDAKMVVGTRSCSFPATLV